jgi:hypothetical protein
MYLFFTDGNETLADLGKDGLSHKRSQVCILKCAEDGKQEEKEEEQ